jgi:hypothetical protein
MLAIAAIAVDTPPMASGTGSPGSTRSSRRPTAPRWARILDRLADLMLGIGLAAAGILVAGALLVAVGANRRNDVVQWLLDTGAWLLGPLEDLFTPANPTWGLVLNHLVGAAVWAFAGWLLARLLRPGPG